MIRTLLLFTFLWFSIHAFAQHQADNWYFGGFAGLSFNSGVPVALTDAQIYTNEGCASLSDTAGNLLFYSDGVSIWDRTHNIMPNGTGLNGSGTCSQSALFVPYPGSDSLFYIFTPPDFVSDSFRYSIIDMTLNNGNGDIIFKNTSLFAPSTEKVTATLHSNGTDEWVVGHSFYNADFYAYLITPAGIDSVPVISSVGTIQTAGIANKIGTMKLSPCGDKIAAVVFSDAFVELFDFDKSTGIVSNPIHLIDYPVYNAWGLFGAEFSPDGSRLYVTQESPGLLIQFDMLAGSPAAIIASADSVAQLTAFEIFGTLQNGPDGKIYISRISHNFLASINDPNNLGAACNFVDSAVSLGSGYAFHGLPNFMSSFFCSVINNPPSASAFAANDTDICEKFCIDFFDSSQGNPISWLWEFPGGTPSSSTDQNPINVCYNNPGTYDVTLITTNAGGSDTLTLSNYITVYTNPFAPVISQAGNTLTSSVATSYQWQLNSVDIPGATNQLYTITQSGLYTVIIGDDNGCTAQASVDASYVGIEEVGTNCFVNVYSNPATNSLMVELLFAGSNGFAGNEITISIFNALGQKVFSSEEKMISGKLKIDISNIVAGIYFLQLQTGASTAVRKFVKE